MIVVSYHSVDPLFKRPVEGAEAASVLNKFGLSPGYIYHGGGFHDRKNAKGVLEAYRQLLDEHLERPFMPVFPPLVISGGLPKAGTTFSSNPEVDAKRLGIEDRVIFIGKVSQEDLPAIYKGASLFVFPSYYEGFGMPVLEAMCQGVPVVTANSSSLPEVGGDAALYCDPAKSDEIAAAMRRILTDAGLRHTLSERAVRRAHTFSWEPFVRDLLRLAKVPA